MEAVEAFKPYRNQFGAVTPTGQVTQNDVLFTAYYLFCVLDDAGVVPDEEFKRLVESMRAYMRLDGSTMRTPESTELDSHDNLTGWAVLSYYLYPLWAKRILSYARENEWIWPGQEPIGNRFLGRHRVVEPILMIAAGEKPDWILSLVYAVNTVISAFASRSNQDAYSLNYSMMRVVTDRLRQPGGPVLMGIACVFWMIVQNIRGWTMADNLKAYGWGDTPYVRYIK